MSDKFSKFEYAAKLAWEFPSVDFEDDGTPYEQPHYTFDTFYSFSEKKIAEMDISEDDFYKQESIIPVLEAYGLDKEKFWYAVAYINLLVSCWTDQKHLSNELPSIQDQLTTMRDEIRNRNEFKIVIDNKLESHSFVMAGKMLIRELVGALDELICKVKSSSLADVFEIPIWREEDQRKKTEQTWYAASMFSILLKKLNLPTIRSRSVKEEFKEKAGEMVKVKGREAFVSYDKNQLIAELVHFLGLTDNEGLDGNSIKGILKKPLKGIGFF